MSSVNARGWAQQIDAAMRQHIMANYEATDSALSPWPDDPDGSTLRFSDAIRKLAAYALTLPDGAGELLMGEIGRAIGIHDTVDHGPMNVAGYMTKCGAPSVWFDGDPSPCGAVLNADHTCPRDGYHANAPWARCRQCKEHSHACEVCGDGVQHRQNNRCTKCNMPPPSEETINGAPANHYGAWCIHGKHIMVRDPHDNSEIPRTVFADPYPCDQPECSRAAIEMEIEAERHDYEDERLREVRGLTT